MSWTVRPARDTDRPGILAVVQAAFADAPRAGDEEVEIVEATWERRAELAGLELVAVDGETVLGYALGARADLDGRSVVAVAPVAVVPEWHGRGVGTAVMTALVERADDQGRPMVAVLGDPGYYGRFGFGPSGPLGITYPPVGPDNPHFMIRRLAAYDPSWRGDLRYCWEDAGEPT